MAKQSGLGDNFYFAGYNISGDVGQLGSISCPTGTLEATGIDKEAFERLGTHRDGMMEGRTFFNDATDQQHEALSSLPRTDVVAMYARGTTIGNPSAAMVAKSIDYAGNRGEDGSLLFTFNAQANSFGLDWGLLGTAGVRTDASATSEGSVTALDGGAATSFGLQAYLQVFSLGSGTATIKLQESSDDDADAYTDVTGGGFTAVTDRTFERIQTGRALAVERYLKVVTTGTFTDLVFAVMIARNQDTVTY